MTTFVRDRWFEHRIEVLERPKVLYEYYVTGRGDFPFDMLRFDHCWPVSSDDADKLQREPGGGGNQMRSIKMRSYRPPTIDRWSSFVWSVGIESLE